MKLARLRGAGRPGFLHFLSLLKIAAVVVFFACLSLPLQAQLSDEASQQIAEILAFKATMTPPEQKMSSNLVLLSRKARGQSLGNLEKFVNTAKADREGRLPIEIGADLSPSLMSSRIMLDIVRKQGLPVAKDPRHGHVHTRLHPRDLLELASHIDVQFLREAEPPMTNVGALTSQGYVTHAANKVVGMGITGAGVTVGVLSDSASSARLAALVASGDLPSDVAIVPGQDGTAFAGSTDEGAAMMEIVHDIAPGAKVVFATGDGGQANFANNIRTLRFAYHCDIIVDDLTYFAEGAFQDGTVAKAVNDVTADGALYFSSSANSGNLTLGTSGTWEGDFLNGGAVGTPLSSGESGLLHKFGVNTYDVMTVAANFISLKWSDPLAASTNDYDLFILNSTGATVKGFSAGAQNGTQDPFEIITVGNNCGTGSATGYCPLAGDRIVVVLFSGATRALRVDTNGGVLSLGTAGATYGHNAGANTMSMAATYWNSAKTGTKSFTGAANPIEMFSSDGPRKIFYNPDGSAITPGNLLFGTNGGTTLQKPDATAADGGSAKTPGFNQFFGTSAAAPHAAGIAALVKSANPSLTNAQVKQILLQTTVDNMAPGIDRDSGYGILMALPAVQAALALP